MAVSPQRLNLINDTIRLKVQKLHHIDQISKRVGRRVEIPYRSRDRLDARCALEFGDFEA